MRFGLERMRRLLTALGSPQERFARDPRRRHERQVLDRAHDRRAAGGATACAPAPTSRRTCVRFAERIRIGDARPRAAARSAPPIQRAAAAAAKVDRTLAGGERVTQFELLTAAAFDELARRGVEVAVVEAGLGGRWDATNVLDARVVRAHQRRARAHRWLGPTVADIAREKLAVVRAGRDARARRRRRPRWTRARRADRRRGSSRPDAGWTSPLPRLPAARTSRVGRARRPQAHAWASCDPDAVAEVAAAACAVPGRMQVVGDDPLTILDGAHNPSGMAALADALPDVVGERPLVAVVCVLDDKDAAGMLRALLPAVLGAVVCTASRNPRALPPATLASLAEQLARRRRRGRCATRARR